MAEGKTAPVAIGFMLADPVAELQGPTTPFYVRPMAEPSTR
jgi:hypothetical protein